jgi:hypothetical protein
VLPGITRGSISEHEKHELPSRPPAQTTNLVAGAVRIRGVASWDRRLCRSAMDAPGDATRKDRGEAVE